MTGRWIALLTLGSFCTLASYCYGTVAPTVRYAMHKSEPVNIVRPDINTDLAHANDPNRGQYLHDFIDWAETADKAAYETVLAGTAGYQGAKHKRRKS